jgi:hypothetical protein
VGLAASLSAAPLATADDSAVSPPVGAADDSFYEPPSPLPDGEPGDIVRAREAKAGPPTARSLADAWQVMYLLMSFFQLTRRFTDSNGKLRTGIAQHLAHTIGGTLIQTVRRWMHLGERAWNLCETT